MATEPDEKQTSLVRIPNSAFAAVGVTTAAEFGAKLPELFSRLATVEQREIPAAFDATALTAQITALEGKISALGTRAEIVAAANTETKTIAENAANNTTTTILGSVGINPQVPANPANPGNQKADDGKDASGKIVDWTKAALHAKAQEKLKK
jgi:hypothetical protein